MMLRRFAALFGLGMLAALPGTPPAMAANSKPGAPGLAVVVLSGAFSDDPSCEGGGSYYGPWQVPCMPHLLPWTPALIGRRGEFNASDPRPLHLAVWEATARRWRSSQGDSDHPASRFQTAPPPAFIWGATAHGVEEGGLLEASRRQLFWSQNSQLSVFPMVDLNGSPTTGSDGGGALVVEADGPGSFPTTGVGMVPDMVLLAGALPGVTADPYDGHLSGWMLPLTPLGGAFSPFLARHQSYEPLALNDIGKGRLSATVQPQERASDEVVWDAVGHSGLSLDEPEVQLPEPRHVATWEQVEALADQQQQVFVASLLRPILRHGRPDMSPRQAQVLASLALMSCPAGDGGCLSLGSRGEQLLGDLEELEKREQRLAETERCILEQPAAVCFDSSMLVRGDEQPSVGVFRDSERAEAVGHWLKTQRHVVEALERQLLVQVVPEQLPTFELLGALEEMDARPLEPRERSRVLDERNARVLSDFRDPLRNVHRPLGCLGGRCLRAWLRDGLRPGIDPEALERSVVAMLVADSLDELDWGGRAARRAGLFTEHLLVNLAVGLGSDEDIRLTPREVEALSANAWADTIRAHGGYTRLLGQRPSDDENPLTVCGGGDEATVRPVHLDLLVVGPDGLYGTAELLEAFAGHLPWFAVDGSSVCRLEATRLAALGGGEALYRLRWRLWSGWHVFYRAQRDESEGGDWALSAWAGAVCDDIVLAETGATLVGHGLLPVVGRPREAQIQDNAENLGDSVGARIEAQLQPIGARTGPSEVDSYLQDLSWAPFERWAAAEGGLLVEILLTDLPSRGLRSPESDTLVLERGGRTSLARLVYLDGEGNRRDLLPKPETELARGHSGAHLGLAVEPGLVVGLPLDGSSPDTTLRAELGLAPVLWPGGARRWGLELGAQGGLGLRLPAFDSLTPWYGVSAGLRIARNPSAGWSSRSHGWCVPNRGHRLLVGRNLSGLRSILFFEGGAPQPWLAGELWSAWSISHGRGLQASLDPWWPRRYLGGFLRLEGDLDAAASGSTRMVFGLRYSGQAW